MAACTRAWRKEKVKKPKGTYWLLKTGRNEDRVSLSLGYITEVEASTALARMQSEEDAGTADNVLALHAADAEGAILYLLGDREAAALLPDPPVNYGLMTLADYFDQQFWPVRSNASTAIGVSAATAEAELGYWRHKGGRDGTGERNGILDGELGRTRLRDLDDQMWERWQESQTQLSPRAKVLRRNAYAALLAWARRQGHSTFTPEFFRIKGSTKTTRPKVDPLTIDEVRALLDAAEREDVPLRGATRRAMWAVGVGQGLRPSELRRVEWPDVNWNDRVMAVRGTKTDASADAIPMTPLAFNELRSLWLRLGQPAEGPCFRYHRRRDGSDALTAHRMGEYKKALREDAEAARINRKVTPYLLRHSFATLAWSLDVPQDVARRIMRHVDLKMLDRVYCRPRPKDLVAKAATFRLDATG